MKVRFFLALGLEINTDDGECHTFIRELAPLPARVGNWLKRYVERGDDKPGQHHLSPARQVNDWVKQKIERIENAVALIEIGLKSVAFAL